MKKYMELKGMLHFYPPAEFGPTKLTSFFAQ